MATPPPFALVALPIGDGIPGVGRPFRIKLRSIAATDGDASSARDAGQERRAVSPPATELP